MEHENDENESLSLQELKRKLVSEKMKRMKLEKEINLMRSDIAKHGKLIDSAKPPPPWERVLYKRQPYPDNYIDASFLEGLVTNAHTGRSSLKRYLSDTAPVIQQTSLVAMFLACSYWIQEAEAGQQSQAGGPSTTVYWMVGAGGAALGLRIGLLWLASKIAPPAKDGLSEGNPSFPQPSSVSRRHQLGSFLLFLEILRAVSPLLRTLTSSYSDDTIYALTFVCFSLHLTFHDYPTTSGLKAEGAALQAAHSNRFRGALSLNAAMFGAVLLASRLHNNELVFGFILFAAELFAFFPMARRVIKSSSTLLDMLVTVFFIFLTSFLLMFRDKTLFAVYICIVLFVSFICPICLQIIQQHKCTIQGPWDIAEVEALH